MPGWHLLGIPSRTVLRVLPRRVPRPGRGAQEAASRGRPPLAGVVGPLHLGRRGGGGQSPARHHRGGRPRGLTEDERRRDGGAAHRPARRAVRRAPRHAPCTGGGLRWCCAPACDRAEAGGWRRQACAQLTATACRSRTTGRRLRLQAKRAVSGFVIGGVSLGGAKAQRDEVLPPLPPPPLRPLHPTNAQAAEELLPALVLWGAVGTPTGGELAPPSPCLSRRLRAALALPPPLHALHALRRRSCYGRCWRCCPPRSRGCSRAR